MLKTTKHHRRNLRLNKWKNSVVKTASPYKLVQNNAIPIINSADFSARIEKPVLNSHNVIHNVLKLRLNSQSETLFGKGSQKVTEMTPIPKFCSRLPLCPGGREGAPSVFLLCCIAFWANLSAEMQCGLVRLLNISKEVKLLVF